MPLIRVTAKKGALDKVTKNKFMSEITDAVLTSEGADLNDPKAESLAWAYYNEQDEDDLFVAKQSIEAPPVLIRVTAPKGGLDRKGKESLASKVNDIVNDFFGSYEGRLNHWLLIDAIDEDGWAANGIIFNIEQIRDAMNIKK